MKDKLIGILGPCAAGKSTLIAGLEARGYNARHIAQEHSYVPDMWQRLTRPDLLVYLDVSYPVSLQRREMNWTQAEFEVQVQRLKHARHNADLYLDTSELSIPDVLSRVVQFIEENSG